MGLATTAITCSGDEFRDLSVDVLTRGQTVRFEARGGSMSPWIRDGDILTVMPQARVRVGDIVFYQSEGNRIIVHRLVKQDHRHGQYLVKGDRLSQADGWISPESILGKIVSLERQGRPIDLERRPVRLVQHVWFRLAPVSNLVYTGLACVRRRTRRMVRSAQIV